MRWMPQAVSSYVFVLVLTPYLAKDVLIVNGLPGLSSLGRERACLADVSSLSPASACLSP